MCIYGYARISTPKQSIDRQVRNIHEAYPTAIVLTEEYTGTRLDRPEWMKLYKKVKSGDTIIFDSVSRMSRDAEDGFALYKELFERNVNLVFLKERHIDTDAFKDAMQGVINVNINSGDNATDELVNSIMAALNKFMMNKVEKDIQKAFEQAEKEVQDLRQRTREGLVTAKLNGKQVGQKEGTTFNVKRKAPIIAIIREKSKDFNGTMTDDEVMAILASKTISVQKDDKGTLKQVSAKVSRNTYYRYKKEAAQM